MAVAGVSPRIMGIGPVPATNKLLDRLGLDLDAFDIIELNEAFSAQALACTRQLGLADDDPRINTRGGAIALGHPVGATGSRLIVTALHELERRDLNTAFITMCCGAAVGTGTIIERI